MTFDRRDFFKTAGFGAISACLAEASPDAAPRRESGREGGEAAEQTWSEKDKLLRTLPGGSECEQRACMAEAPRAAKVAARS